MNSIIVRGTGAESTSEFTSKFRLVSQFLLSSNPQITTIHCICPDKKLFRVSFEEKSTRIEIMKEAHKLKDSTEYKNIFISRDLKKANVKQQQRKEEPGMKLFLTMHQVRQIQLPILSLLA